MNWKNLPLLQDLSLNESACSAQIILAFVAMVEKFVHLEVILFANITSWSTIIVQNMSSVNFQEMLVIASWIDSLQIKSVLLFHSVELLVLSLECVHHVFEATMSISILFEKL